MMTFSLLDKTEKDKWLPVLFDLLYANMKSIAPSGLSYDDEKREWLANVSPALDKAPRQIIVCFDGETVVGYIQYYTRDKLLVIEEIQLDATYHRTMLFYRLCKHLMNLLPENIEWIEAYAEMRNLNSQRIMRKLGMETVDDGCASPFVHLRGSAQTVRRFFSR